jgi:hypothetical protein
MSDDDSSVGHPEHQPDSTFGSALDAYFNLNPEKFGVMPTGEFLKLAKEYQSVSESYEKTKKVLLELDEKKKELEDDARAHSAVGVSAEQLKESQEERSSPLELAIEAAEPHDASPTEQHIEQPDDRPPVEAAPEDPIEQPVEQSEQNAPEQPAYPEQPVDQPADDGHPHISHAETDIGAGPAL